MFASKYFVCAQLKRIFCPPGSRSVGVWWAFQILIFMIIAYYIALLFSFLFQCVPREKIWNLAVQGRCIDFGAAYLSVTIINLIFDLGILCLPIWVIWHLRLPLQRKLGALCIFGVGIFTCAIAAIGVAYRVSLIMDTNKTFQLGRVAYWSFTEVGATIFVGCMPVFPRFYEHCQSSLRPRFDLQSVRKKSTRNTNPELSHSTERITCTERAVLMSEPTQDDWNSIELGGDASA